MNEQFAALLPKVTDRVAEALAETERTGPNPPTPSDQNTFIFYDPVPQGVPDNFFELEKNYAWKRALFNTKPLATGATPFPTTGTTTKPLESEAETAYESGFSAIDFISKYVS
jgi:hypothetical protein